MFTGRLSKILLVIFFALSTGCLGTEDSGTTENASSGGGGGSSGGSEDAFRGAEKATGESINSIQVEWKLPGNEQDIGSFNVYEVTGSTDLTLLTVMGAGDPAFFHVGLSPGETHRYVVRGLDNASGEEDTNMRIVQATTPSSDGNPLLISPESHALAYGQTFFYSASGGEEPYKYQLISGPGAILDDTTGEFVALFSAGLAVVKVSDASGNVSYGAVNVSAGFQLYPENYQLMATRHLQIDVAGATAPVTYDMLSGTTLATLSPTGYLESNGALGLVTVRVTDGTGLIKDALIQIVTEMNPQSSHLLSMGYRHQCYAQKQGNKLKCWGNSTGGAVPTSQGANVGDQAGEMGDSLPTSDLGNTAVPLEIKSGSNFNCVLFSNNQLKCFGTGVYGNLLNGSNTNFGDEAEDMGNSLPFLNLGTGRSVKDFVVTHISACAILDNDSVKCWGYHGYGVLGSEGVGGYLGNTGSELGEGLPYVDLRGRTAKKIASGGQHVCVILDDDTLKCWGYNAHGQLGLGDTSHRGDTAGEMAALGTVNIGTVKDVSANMYTTCVITTADQVKCWGYNNYGELGQGHRTYIGNTTPVDPSLPAIDLGTGLTPKKVTAGEHSTCVIFTNDRMKCWGNNLRIMSLAGHLGDGAGEMGDSLPFMDFGFDSGFEEKVLSVTNGAYSDHACALLSSNKVKCWGYNTLGQLGLGDVQVWGNTVSERGDGLPYVDLGTGRTVISVAAGNTHSCAVLDNDTVKCWGGDTSGSLGQGGNIIGDSVGELAVLEEIRLGDSLLIKKISSGDGSTCVLYYSGQMKCFGTGGHGRLANGSSANLGDNPGEVTDSLGFSTLSDTAGIDDIDLGYLSGCAKFDNGKAKCWGYNPYGQLGQEHKTTIGDSPSEVGSDTALPFIDLGLTDTVKQIVSGTHLTCAITTDNEVKCWGYNGHGQMGRGDKLNIGDEVGEMGTNLTAIDLGVPDANPVQMSLGQYSPCVVFDNGKVKCWGYNAQGQLGLGDTQHRGDNPGEMGTNLPYLDLGADFYAIKVVASYYAHCALSRDQRVKCWGYGLSGMLGIGSTTNIGNQINEMGSNLAYVNFGAYKRVVDLYGGKRNGYFCATLDSNEIKCWGRNSDAELGLGDIDHHGDGPGEMGDSLSAILVTF